MLKKILLLTALVACGGNSNNSKGDFKAKTGSIDPMPSNMKSTSSAYLTSEDLPTCNESRELNLAYMISEKSLKYCSKGKWIDADIANSNKTPEPTPVNPNPIEPEPTPWNCLANYTMLTDEGFMIHSSNCSENGISFVNYGIGNAGNGYSERKYQRANIDSPNGSIEVRCAKETIRYNADGSMMYKSTFDKNCKLIETIEY